MTTDNVRRVSNNQQWIASVSHSLAIGEADVMMGILTHESANDEREFNDLMRTSTISVFAQQKDINPPAPASPAAPEATRYPRFVYVVACTKTHQSAKLPTMLYPSDAASFLQVLDEHWPRAQDDHASCDLLLSFKDVATRDAILAAARERFSALFLEEFATTPDALTLRVCLVPADSIKRTWFYALRDITKSQQ